MRLLPGRPDHGGRDLLTRIPSPSDEQIEAQQTNLCRCGTYSRIRKAIHRAAGEVA